MNPYTHLQLASRTVGLLLGLCFGCQPNVSMEHERSGQSTRASDTVEVTKFSLEREMSPALANWKAYHIKQALISLPPQWLTKVEDETFIATPNNPDVNEKLTFTFYKIDIPNPDYDGFAKKLNNESFTEYSIMKDDSLKKIELEKNFCYERNVELKNATESYKGLFLVYATDSCLYEYHIVLSQKQLAKYQGDLMQDLIGNLKLGDEYLFGNHNKFRRIVRL